MKEIARSFFRCEAEVWSSSCRYSILLADREFPSGSSSQLLSGNLRLADKQTPSPGAVRFHSRMQKCNGQFFLGWDVLMRQVTNSKLLTLRHHWSLLDAVGLDLASRRAAEAESWFVFSLLTWVIANKPSASRPEQLSVLYYSAHPFPPLIVQVSGTQKNQVPNYAFCNNIHAHLVSSKRDI